MECKAYGSSFIFYYRISRCTDYNRVQEKKSNKKDDRKSKKLEKYEEKCEQKNSKKFSQNGRGIECKKERHSLLLRKIFSSLVIPVSLIRYNEEKYSLENKY